MDKLTENLPAIIAAAAQSHLGLLALLSVALSVLAYFFFSRASEKVKVGIFVLLFFGVAGFGAAMFRAAPEVQIADSTTATPAPPPQQSVSTGPSMSGPTVYGGVKGGVVATTIDAPISIDNSTTTINPPPPKKVFSSCLKTLEDIGASRRYGTEVRSNLRTIGEIELGGSTALYLNLSNRISKKSTEDGFPESIGSFGFKFEEGRGPSVGMDPRFKASSGGWEVTGFCNDSGLQIEISRGYCQNTCAGGGWVSSVYSGLVRTDGRTATISFSSSPFSGSPLSINQNAFQLYSNY